MFFNENMISKSNSNISFSSQIRLINNQNFNKLASRISNKNYVRYPWSVNEIVKDSAAYTRNIFDCTAGGVTDGQDVVMFHIAANKQNIRNFDAIQNKILSNLSLQKQNLQGFLLGSANEIDKSRKLFSLFENFFKKNDIDYSAISGFKFDTSSNILYDSSKDCWFVTHEKMPKELSQKISSKNVLEDIFAKINISKNDELI